jgi:hypothetical protein
MGKLGVQPDRDQQACEKHRARRNQTQRRSGLAGALAGNKMEPELYARADLSDGFKELRTRKQRRRKSAKELRKQRAQPAAKEEPMKITQEK